jgi:hypothetical protein
METAAHPTTKTTTTTVSPAAALSSRGQCQEASNKEKLCKFLHKTLSPLIAA